MQPTTPPFRRVWPVGIAALLLLPALGAVAPGGARAAPEGPAVLLQPVDGPAREARWVGTEGTDLVLDVEGRRERVAASDVEALAPREATPARTPAGHLRLALTGGERLLGRRAGAMVEGLVLELASGHRVAVPFEATRSMATIAADADPCDEPEQRYGPQTDGDVVYVRGGDRYTGLVVDAREEGLALLDARDEEAVVPWEDLLVAHLENEAPEAPPGPSAEIELVDGSVLRTRSVPTIEGSTLHLALRSVPDATLAVPFGDVRHLRILGGRAVLADTLAWEGTYEHYYDDGDEEYAAYLERWYGARAGRHPDGCPLRLGGRTWRHGFAAHARSRIRLPLDGAYTTFRARVGIDDRVVAEATERRGDVDLRVLGDGEVLWEATGVRGGDAPRMVGPLDVSDVDALVLEVDFGQDLHVMDRVTWAEPVLLR